MNDSEQSTIDRIIQGVAECLLPLRNLSSSEGVFALMRRLGYPVPLDSSDSLEFSETVQLLDDVLDALAEFAAAEAEVDRVQRTADLVISTTAAISSIKNAADLLVARGTRAGLNPDGSEVLKRLADHLLVSYLERNHRGLLGLLRMLGVVEVVTAHDSIVSTVNPGVLLSWLKEPGGQAELLYQWKTDPNIEKLAAAIEVVARGFGFAAGEYREFQPVGMSAGEDIASGVATVLPLIQVGKWPDSFGEVGIRLGQAAGEDAEKRLYVMPYAHGGVQAEVDLAPGLSFRSSIHSSMSEVLVIGPGKELAFFTTEPGGLESDDSHLEISLDYTFAKGRSVFSALGSGVRLGGIRVLVEAYSRGDDREIKAELRLEPCDIVLALGGQDSFLRETVSDDALAVTLGLVFGFSSLDGFYFGGGASLEVEIPVHVNAGPISVHTIHALLALDASAIALTVAATFGASLGPISVLVQRAGVRLNVAIAPEVDGNLGILSVGRPGFAPPTGAGLAIDAGAVSGGGFVAYTDADQSYAGILALKFGEIGLTAIGLITTKMPDGSPGFAMVLSIMATFNPQIQLSFGFTLGGVGGLAAVNRTMLVDVLRAGLKQHTLDSILFPEDPILNAPKIISDLKAVFPVEEGRYVIGPMAKIGWGGDIVQADIGIMIELPEPVRVVILGEIAARLPRPSDAIIELHIDVLGVLDFSKKTLAIDASIYDSKILTYSLSGDAALRLSWDDENPQLCMALGGFHPSFSAPPGFPELKRLTLDLSSGSTIELACRTYQALTSNTLQFGARIDAHAEADGATLDGDLSFDGLIYFSPFSFSVDMGGGMTAGYKGHKLGGVRLDLTLSGPTPWRAKGNASFEILAWDVAVSFNKSWGREGDGSRPAVNAWEELQLELADAKCWGASLPAGAGVEALRELKADAGVVAHPAGRLEVRQRLVPLGVKLNKIANSPIAGPDRFDISAIVIGVSSDAPDGENIPDEIREYFARGQFQDLSASEKLSLPAYEKLIAGAAATWTSFRLIGMPEACPLVYESSVIGGDGPALRSSGGLNGALGLRLLRRSAAARSAVGGRGLLKFVLPGRTPVVSTREPTYEVVASADLTPVAATGEATTATTRVEADQRRASLVATGPSQASKLIVVESAEVNRAPADAETEAQSETDELPPESILAHYYFIPAVRRGLATAIEQAATAVRATIDAKVIVGVDGEPFGFPQTIQLYGPSDVVGFDARVVARTDPRRDVGDFEPNFFPSIEFNEPDFPWRFSAEAPVAGLRPWITLIVLQEGEFNPMSNGAKGTPRTIEVAKALLPDLDAVALWAHVHLVGQADEESGDGIDAVDAALLEETEQTAPERAVARLVAARRLEAGKQYHAFVVPTFKLSRVALDCATAVPEDTACTLAWGADDPETIKLPYYYHWRFGTGLRGDFEYLVELLEPRVLNKLGVRPMDCSQPGYGLQATDAATTSPLMLELEGALRSLDTILHDWGFAETDVDAASVPATLQTSLAQELLNKPAIDRAPRSLALGTAGDIDDLMVVLKPSPLVTAGEPTFSAEISWEGDATQTAVVELGTTAAYGQSETAAYRAGRHYVKFSGLEPSEIYHFLIATTGPDDAVGTSGDLTIDAPGIPMPTVVPPIYGSWHAARETVSPPPQTTGKSTWFEEANLDPRHRAAAGFGALVAEQQQEALMASAWDQLGGIDQANQLLRYGQLGREAAMVLFGRLTSLLANDEGAALGDFLRMTAPVHARVLHQTDEGSTTVSTHLAGSRVTSAAFDPALRRLARRRGPLRRRQDPIALVSSDDMLRRLNGSSESPLSAAPPLSIPHGTLTPCGITMRLRPDDYAEGSSGSGGSLAGGSGGGGTGGRPVGNGPGRTAGSLAPDLESYDVVDFGADDIRSVRFCESQITCMLVDEALPDRVSSPDLLNGLDLRALRRSLCDWLDNFPALDVPAEPPERPIADLEALAETLKDALDPRITVRDRVLSRLDLNLPPTTLALREQGDPLAPLTASPEFPQPMYEPLRDISQDLILPNVQSVPQNTLGLLKTNRRFVEAYMLGLNHAFTGEALWRGAPVGGRATYFRQFWDVEDSIAAAAAADPSCEPALKEQHKDIDRLLDWGGSRLGDNPPPTALDLAESIVLLVRGDVLKKYPNTLVYAVPAVPGSESDRVPGLADFSKKFAEGCEVQKAILPVFSGSLPPDLTFFGFPFAEDDVRGKTTRFPHGLYFVLEERVSEARFGYDDEGDDEPPVDLDSWDKLTANHFGSDPGVDGVYATAWAKGKYLNAMSPSPLAESSPPSPAWNGPAAVACATLQRPVRVAVFAEEMLPPPRDSPPT